MPTLILSPKRSLDSEALSHAAFEAGWQCFSAPGWRLPPDHGIADPVLYADPLFADVAAGPFGLALLEPPADWPACLPERWRRREVRYLTLGEARRLPGPLFCKPAEDKSFPATVYAGGANIPGEDMYPDDMPVLVAEPVTWEAEYRCFVLERQVVATSLYLEFGRLAVDRLRRAPKTGVPEATEFAATVVADPAVELPPAVVMDVGRIAGRGWAVVEANAAWGSGIYACDAVAVLPVLRRACVPRAALTPEDARWARPFRDVIG